MDDLEITENGIYYFHKYVPRRKREWEIYKDYVDISELIISYKYTKVEGVNDFFTNEIEQALVYISNKILFKNVSKIALVAVPPSEVDKYSPIRKSINKIVNKYEKGRINDFKYINEIHNCSELLIRKEDVDSSKDNKSSRVFIVHYASIDFDEDLISDLDDEVVYILLDDITTTGFTMNVCEEILIDNGINEDNIYKLVIAKTVE